MTLLQILAVISSVLSITCTPLGFYLMITCGIEENRKKRVLKEKLSRILSSIGLFSISMIFWLGIFNLLPDIDTSVRGFLGMVLFMVSLAMSFVLASIISLSRKNRKLWIKIFERVMLVLIILTLITLFI